jgi:hypothetical protein
MLLGAELQVSNSAKPSSTVIVSFAPSSHVVVHDQLHDSKAIRWLLCGSLSCVTVFAFRNPIVRSPPQKEARYIGAFVWVAARSL